MCKASFNWVEFINYRMYELNNIIKLLTYCHTHTHRCAELVAGHCLWRWWRKTNVRNGRIGKIHTHRHTQRCAELVVGHCLWRWWRKTNVRNGRIGKILGAFQKLRERWMVREREWRHWGGELAQFSLPNSFWQLKKKKKKHIVTSDCVYKICTKCLQKNISRIKLLRERDSHLSCGDLTYPSSLFFMHVLHCDLCN